MWLAAVELLGGGVAGDLVGLPASQLAILPGATPPSRDSGIKNAYRRQVQIRKLRNGRRAMADKRKTPKSEKARQKQQEATPEVEGRPVTTGDMQEVGATDPEEVPERQNVDGEAPVHEDPGNQNSG